VFDKVSIAAPKEKASSMRVAAVSALIWKRLMALAISKSKPAPVTAATRVHVAIHAVNLRPRTVPPMPTHSFGNLCYFAAASVVLSPHDQLDHDGGSVMIMIVIGRWRSN
jgi:hypothetical protein